MEVSGGLSSDLVLSIQRVLELQAEDDTDDPLNTLSSDFDPVVVLNQLFSDEKSLGKLAEVQERLAADEAALQAEINDLHAELARNQDPARMQLIQEMISDLLGQMSRIREKATESEAVVRNITRDIQALDTAKKNLILSMTTLKRLQMLVNALTQLEELVEARKYTEVAQTLGAVKQIADAFKPYQSIPRVAQVWRQIQEIQSTLRSMIDADFDAFYIQDPAHPIKASTISAACAAADALGSDARTHLVDRYVALELKDYRRVFRVATENEAAALDNAPRRYAWFRRRLSSHEVEAGRVFPADWRIAWALFAKFVEITKDDMTTLLSQAGNKLTVQALLDAVQQTTEFESSITKKFATPIREILRQSSPSPAKPILPISSAFEPHMGVWIAAQDRALADMLSRYGGAASRSSLDIAAADTESDDVGASTSPIVLPSSTELFYFYAQSLDSCAKLSVGTGKILWDLSRVQRRWLRTYAEDVLVASMKRTPPINQPRRSMDSRFDQQEFKNACVIINTADYCQNTAEELEEKIKEKIGDEFKEQVTFQAERDLFLNVISAAINVQLRGLEHALEPPLSLLSRTLWSLQRQVSGPSPYTSELSRAIESVVSLAKPAVEGKKYLRNWLDKAAGLIQARFTNAIVRSRPLREVGAEQLLIDLQEVKACLLKLPGEDLASSSYTRNVTKSITNLDALLKVIVTPMDPPEGFILNYTLQIGDASFSNFQKVLDLKGTPKTEQGALLDDFLKFTSTRTELKEKSFLSTLDMNPPVALAPPPTFPTAPTSPGPALGAVLGEGIGILAALGSPPLGMTQDGQGSERKEGLSEGFKRFVSFGLRRENSGQPS